MEALRSQLLDTLKEEADFGTTNHYLQQKHVEEQLMPDSLIEMTITALFGSDLCLTSHQSSLPNAAKGYPPREPREHTDDINITSSRASKDATVGAALDGARGRGTARHLCGVARPRGTAGGG